MTYTTSADVGLLLLRLAVGITFLAHGSQKLLGWFGGPGIEGTARFFGDLGFRPPHVHARLAGFSEFCGGLFLALGFLTPLASILVFTVMLVAIATVHLPKGFFNADGGYELNLTLAIAALCLAFTGPGTWSLDRALGITPRVWWGPAVLIVALLAAVVTVGSRAHQAPSSAQPVRP